MPNDDIYDTLYHLSWSDIMDNDPIYPSRLEMHYKGLYNEPISSGHLHLLAKSYPLFDQFLLCWITW